MPLTLQILDEMIARIAGAEPPPLIRFPTRRRLLTLTSTQGGHMPDAALDEWGAVVGCTGECCRALRPREVISEMTWTTNPFPIPEPSLLARGDNTTTIHPYSYKPPAKFAGDGPLYLGVELEVDRERERRGKRGRIVDWHENPDGVLNPLSLLSQSNTLFYFKDDGSLENGFELVTHPCSLSYHQASFPWQDVLEELKKTGLQSHNTQTCGLHIHASRLGFGQTTKQQEAVLGKLIMLWGRHWWRYAQLSRRRVQELSSWCLPNREAVDVVEEDMVEMLETVKKPSNRSVAINTVPWEQGDRGKETVEFRLFKGTLNYSSLMAALEIVHHSITLAKSWRFDKVVKSRWRDVVGDAEERGYTYLVDYVKERGVE